MFRKDPVILFKKRAEKWFLDLQDYNEERLFHRPAPDQWCLAELYDHIMRVANTYQIPNFLQCIEHNTKKGRAKKSIAYLIFNLNIVPYRNIKMESFPNKIVSDFTPEILDKKLLESNFKDFIAETIAKESLLKSCDKTIKHNHPFFGMINAIEWYSLIEIHMRHHERQKKLLEAIII